MALRLKSAYLINHFCKRPLLNSITQQKDVRTNRFLATFSNDLSVKVDTSGVAVISMNKPPVNSLSLEFIKNISQAIKDLEASQSCRGFILTSEVPKVFSAGLDIMEMYQPKPDRLKDFWNSLQQMWLDLYLTKLVSFAAITGHAPAGGCLLAMSCDYRIMVQPAPTIGLNETLLGIVAPFWFKDTAINVIGQRETEIALSLGKMYPAEEALKKGLVDELVSSPEEALQRAQEEIKKWIQIPPLARQLTKQQLRGKTAQHLIKARQQDIEAFISLVTKENTQKSLGKYLESLKKRRA